LFPARIFGFDDRGSRAGPAGIDIKLKSEAIAIKSRKTDCVQLQRHRVTTVFCRLLCTAEYPAVGILCCAKIAMEGNTPSDFFRCKGCGLDRPLLGHENNMQTFPAVPVSRRMPHPGALSTRNSAHSHAGGGPWPSLPVAPRAARALVKGLVARAAAIVKGPTRGGVVVGAAENRFPTVQYSACGDMPVRRREDFLFGATGDS
jgi:hypothetical protein